MIPIERRAIAFAEYGATVTQRIESGLSYAHLCVRRDADGTRLLETLMLDRKHGGAEVVTAPITQGLMEIPSLTSNVPAAHWAERLTGDLWGIRFAGHSDWKSLILNHAWPPDRFPLSVPADGEAVERDSSFMTVSGDGVHEIPVGPIHAGVIEPGHFRFSCLGEVIASLEIRLGYLHRGVESALQDIAPRHARHLVENAASDMTVANALAHAVAVEGLLGIEPPPRAQTLRTISLEVERVANHLGDLGALASDVGFAVVNATFARLRGDALGIGQKIGGTRYQTGYVLPGGVAWDVTDAQILQADKELSILVRDTIEVCELLFSNGGVQERFEGVGVLPADLALQFGMVGPSARASRSTYDARTVFPHGLYPDLAVETASQSTGDVWARAKIRRKELEVSLDVIKRLLSEIPTGPYAFPADTKLHSNQVGLGVVESWRGELIHWITTDSDGRFSRYVIRDPSFQDWTGLAIAVRGNLVADFPIINKSFNLSYSGSDL